MLEYKEFALLSKIIAWDFIAYLEHNLICLIILGLFYFFFNLTNMLLECSVRYSFVKM